jgi:hypothetical protein
MALRAKGSFLIDASMIFHPSKHPPLTAPEALQLMTGNLAPDAKAQANYHLIVHFK